MVLGLLVFLRRQYILGPIGLPPAGPAGPAKAGKNRWGISKQLSVYLLSVLAIPLIVLILQYYPIYSYIINPFGILSLAYVLYAGSKEGKAAFLKLMVSLVLIIFSSLFWAFYEQGGGSLNLFADRNVNMNLAGVELSSAAVKQFHQWRTGGGAFAGFCLALDLASLQGTKNQVHPSSSRWA
jgi:POT family proton-dependent oligopeptide transporter